MESEIRRGQCRTREVSIYSMKKDVLRSLEMGYHALPNWRGGSKFSDLITIFLTDEDGPFLKGSELDLYATELQFGKHNDIVNEQKAHHC